MVESLIAAKADVNALGQLGGFLATPLFAAAMNCNVRIMQLLLEAGADIDGQKVSGKIYS